MKPSIRMGVAWMATNREDPEKHHFNVSLELGGLLEPIPARIAQNPSPKNEDSPSHLLFLNPVGEDSEDGLIVGSFWERKTQDEAHRRYLMGKIYPHKFRKIRVGGGPTIDFRGASSEGVSVKLCERKDREGEREPGWILLRVTPQKKSETNQDTSEGEEEASEAA